MEHTVLANKQPQFTDLATFALRLVQAASSWRDPQSGEDIFACFQQRHPGDELGLRASLIREHILPAFNYILTQIEYESRERFDLVLRSRNQQNRRRIAIIETKSSAIRKLATVRGGNETPVEQLERYLSQAGLYLGVLTNGDEWYLFDFALGREPLAAFSIIELAYILQGVERKEEAEKRLQEHLPLRQALTIIFYYLDARRWEQADVLRENLANNAYFHIASLQVSQDVETLVQHIKQVLGSLRETIRAQFNLLQRRNEEYQQLCTYTSHTDDRLFQEMLQDTMEKVGQFGTAFHMYDDGPLREEILLLLRDLCEQYLADGDIAAFESDYLQQARDILTKYQLSQISLVEKKEARSVNLLPPLNGLDALKMLLQTHYMYVKSLQKEYDLSIKTTQAYFAWKTGVRGIFRAPEDELKLPHRKCR